MMTFTFIEAGTGQTIELTPVEALAIVGPVRIVWDAFTGRFVKLTGGPAIADKLQANFLLFYGEWHLDSSIGFPWFEFVLGKKPDIGLIEQMFRRLITKVKGIRGCERVSLSYDGQTRKLGVSYRAKTLNGYTIQVSDEPIRVLTQRDTALRPVPYTPEP